MNRFSIAGAALVGAVGLLAGPSIAQQETKQEAKSASGHGQGFSGYPAATQFSGQELNQFSADQRQLCPDAFLSRQADRSRQRQEPARRMDIPDRRQGIAGDFADRRRRRHVRDDVVQPRLCARRQDRRAALALQSQDGTDHDLLLRPQQSRRPGSRRPRLSRHAGLQTDRPECQDRRGRLEDRHRRSRAGLQRDDGADRHQGQGSDRNQRRRIRHPRLREGL